MKTHSDPHHSPSAALLIKDSNTTTKIGASCYHHRAERTHIMFVCLFVFQFVYAGVLAAGLLVVKPFIFTPFSLSCDTFIQAHAVSTYLVSGVNGYENLFHKCFV